MSASHPFTVPFTDMNPQARALAVVVLLGGLLACRRVPSRTAHAQIEAWIAAEPARHAFTLSEIQDVPPWTSLHVFAPYTSTSAIEARLGFGWPDAARFRIQQRDDIHLAVFTAAEAVVRAEEWRRSAFDCSPALSARAWTPRDTLRIDRDSGRVLLAPAGPGNPAPGTQPAVR